MDKIFITESRSAISIDQDGNVSEVKRKFVPIDWATVLEKDCTIEYKQNGETKSVNGKAGQIVLVYYKNSKNMVVVVDSQQMIENFEGNSVISYNHMSEDAETTTQG